MNTTPHCWQFPPKGFLKLNTDASCMGDEKRPGASSYGGILRDESGGWVKAICGKLRGVHTPVEAEVWAILKGLNMMKEFGYSKVFVETDSVAAMHLFSFIHLRQNHPLKDAIESGLGILKNSQSVIVHTRRGGNHCADRLAALGGKQVGEYNVIHTPPHEVMKVFLTDRFGIEWRQITCSSHHPVWALPLEIRQASYPKYAPLHHHGPPPLGSPMIVF